MATSVIGLKTHIWNNNLKSFLFIFAYPIIITPLYISVAAIILGFFRKTDKHPGLDFNYTETLKTIVFDYWYIPYLLVLIFLYIVYKTNMNRIDIEEGRELVTRKTNPKLYDMLENLCISRGLNMPYLFIYNNMMVNAYTSGISEHTFYIVVSRGLLMKLNEHEVEAVIAHELTHIINRDTRLLFLTGTVSHMLNQLSLFFNMSDSASYSNRSSSMIALSVVFKIASVGSLFAQLFVSRKREFMADAGAIELTKNPEALISALRKISGSQMPFERNAVRKPLYIHYSQPSDLFSTHPSIEKRIEAIEMFSRIDTTELEAKAPLIDEGYQPIIIPDDKPVKTADNADPKDIW